MIQIKGAKCIGCGEHAVQADHIWPRHAGGPDTDDNLAPLCIVCNVVKSCCWPWHGYHPHRGFNDPARAWIILQKEIAWAESQGRDPWGSDCEPGPWAWSVMPSGLPEWLGGSDRKE